ncbi:hypothetical protein B4N89_44785 [Embleya scabrispora]|uniref:Uncharacterized protein n=1 Tax=Embleya scabrispora TaxID=159449 RepID=A0A1T3NJ32_9ACTN|nr:hypothetical protein B4N89_44785 [Embleya scabrispora]
MTAVEPVSARIARCSTISRSSSANAAPPKPTGAATGSAAGGETGGAAGAGTAPAPDERAGSGRDRAPRPVGARATAGAVRARFVAVDPGSGTVAADVDAATRRGDDAGAVSTPAGSECGAEVGAVDAGSVLGDSGAGMSDRPAGAGRKWRSTTFSSIS